MNDPGQILVFDRALLRRRRDRAAGSFAAHGALFEETAAQLIERLDGIRQDFGRALDLGAHQGGLGRRLLGRGIPSVVACELSEKMLQQAQIYSPPPEGGVRGGGTTQETPSPAKTKALLRKTKFSLPLPQGEKKKYMAIAGDEEFLPFAPASFDLIASNLSLHWVNDLPGALLQIRNALRPDGLFLAAVAGGGSLHELRACLLDAETAVAGGVSPRLSPMIELTTASGLLQRAGFALPVADQEQITLAYPDAFALMRDLRGMGMANAGLHRLRRFTRRQIFIEAARLYKERFALADGRVPLTFEILFLHGRKPAIAGS